METSKLTNKKIYKLLEKKESRENHLEIEAGIRKHNAGIDRRNAEIEAGIRKHNAGIDRRNAERSQGFCSNYDTSRTDARVQEAREDTDYWEWTGQMYGNPYLNLPGSQVLLPLSTFMGNQAKKTEKRVEYDAIRAEIRARSR